MVVLTVWLVGPWLCARCRAVGLVCLVLTFAPSVGRGVFWPPRHPRHLTTRSASGRCTGLVWTSGGRAVTPTCRLPYLLVLSSRLRLDGRDALRCTLIRLSVVPLRSRTAALVINNQSPSGVINFTAGRPQPGNPLASSPGPLSHRDHKDFDILS